MQNNTRNQNHNDIQQIMARARDSMQRGDMVGAIADFTEVLLKDSANVAAYAERCIAWARTGDFESAFADSNQIIRLQPQSAVGYYLRGMILARHHDMKGALHDYTDAILRDPRHVNAYANRGALHREMGNAAG